MVSIKSRWRCHECGELHDYEEDALECCPTQISEVYVCPGCNDQHSLECETLECCGYDPEAPPLPPTTDELEALGQMRLLP
jgi:hypothetical protein